MKLSTYETHKMIKAHVPEAKTVWEKEQGRRQYEFPFMNKKNWRMTHNEVKAIDPELYNNMLRNIERSDIK